MNSSANVEPELVTVDEPKTAADGGCQVSVAEGYERWARTYDQGPNPLLAREERHLTPLLKGLRGKSILDLACGTGRWLEKLTAQGASGVGIDCSAAMLGVAGNKEAIKQRLARGACESLPFRTAVFDLAICSFALGHIRNLRSLVRELARVMKPGADVFVSDLHPEAYAGGWRVGFRDEHVEVQIDTEPRSRQLIVEAFSSSGFDCQAHEPLWLADPEQAIFACAGKSHLFKEACQVRAVLFCHFRRRHSDEARL